MKKKYFKEETSTPELYSLNVLHAVRLNEHPPEIKYTESENHQNRFFTHSTFYKHVTPLSIPSKRTHAT